MIPAPSPLPLRLFAFLCIPLASWQVWIFPFIPNYYAQHLFIYPCLLFMLWAWGKGLWTLHDLWLLLRPFLPCLAALFLLQMPAEWRSARLFCPQEAPLWPMLLKGAARLMSQIPFFFFFVLLCQILLRDAAGRRNLLRGAVCTMLLLFLWCLVQGAYVYTWAGGDYPPVPPPDEPWYRTALRRLILTVSPWLEARWSAIIYDFYKNGAYVLTSPRFNGFFEEASALAAVVGVFFIPLSFGLLSLGRRYPRFLALGAIGLVGSLAALVFCRSGTGQILAAVSLGLLLLLTLRSQRKFLTTALALLLISGCVAAALFAPHVPSYLLHRTRYSDVMKSPRVICTLDTLDMVRRYPLLGVGRSWYFAHLHEGKRYVAHLPHPELSVWKKNGRGGELSALPALAAQYGLPVVLAALCFILHIRRRLQRLKALLPDDPLAAFMAGAATAWLLMAFVTCLFSIDIRNALFSLPFYFFYAATRELTTTLTARDKKGERE